MELSDYQGGSYPFYIYPRDVALLFGLTFSQLEALLKAAADLRDLRDEAKAAGFDPVEALRKAHPDPNASNESRRAWQAESHARAICEAAKRLPTPLKRTRK